MGTWLILIGLWYIGISCIVFLAVFGVVKFMVFISTQSLCEAENQNFDTPTDIAVWFAIRWPWLIVLFISKVLFGWGVGSMDRKVISKSTGS